MVRGCRQCGSSCGVPGCRVCQGKTPCLRCKAARVPQPTVADLAQLAADCPPAIVKPYRKAGE